MDGNGSYSDKVFIERLGEQSSTERSICRPTQTDGRPSPGPMTTSVSTTLKGPSKLWGYKTPEEVFKGDLPA